MRWDEGDLKAGVWDLPGAHQERAPSFGAASARHDIRHRYLAEVRHALETWDADLADIIAGFRQAALCLGRSPDGWPAASMREGATAATFTATKCRAAVFREQAAMKDREMTLTELEGEPDAGAQSDGYPSFEQAFAEHHRVVYRYACALTRDGGLAEDAAQEVFLRLHRQRIAGGILRAWLLRVTANVARNLLRTRRRSDARDQAFAVEALQRQERRLPDEELGRESEIRRAQEALGKLDEPQRSCLLLRHEGLSYREIAAALGVKESQVGSLIARSRMKFIRLYGRAGKDR